MKGVQHLKIYIVMLLIIITIFLSGCWDRRELNKLSIVAGLGWDIDPGTGEVTVTYQSIVPSQIRGSSSSGGSGEEKGSTALQSIRLDHSTGSSTYDALNRYAQHGSRILFYQHTMVYIFGKEGAQQGIYQIIETIARNPVSRPTVLMAVSDIKASDVLEVQDGIENIQAFGMADEMELSAKYTKYPAITYLEFANRLKSETTAPIAPMVGIFEDTGPEGKKTKQIRITGTAVFKGDRMIGELSERESSGLLWAINKIKKGYVMISGASLEIVRAKSKIIPELQDSKIKITIEIDEESDLMGYKGHQDITSEILQALEKDQAKEIESQVMEAVEKSFTLNADVFGFGDAVHRRYKNEWKDLKGLWDEIYPRIEVAVKVKTHLDGIGDINKALLKD